MRIVDVIANKRDGGTLSRDEIEFFVAGLGDGRVLEYQASALLMAIYLRGMTAEETSWLTGAMVHSGERLDLSDIPGPKVGKHSTGGVGDKVSIVLAPVAAACGLIVPKMSGRGLGHTGGTVDKLESIPGFRLDLSIAAFKDVLRSVGTCIIGQTATLAPADKRLYALRDVTATIESIPLIAASIMSKKLAEGTSALVLDVKCGDGAFMKSVDRARALGAAMVAIGARAGVRTEAVLTNMDAPLGTAVGNALEIAECVATLQGQGSPPLRAVVGRLATRMVVLSGLETDNVAASVRVETALASGRALETFRRMVIAQGGDPAFIDEPSRLPVAPDRMELRAPRSGIVTAVRAEGIGRASAVLGAGRVRAGDPVDHAVGAIVRVHPGMSVEQGDSLLTLHHRGATGLEEALVYCRSAIDIGDVAPPVAPDVIDEVREGA